MRLSTLFTLCLSIMLTGLALLSYAEEVPPAYQRTIGEYGSDDGHLSSPNSVALHGGEIYVLEAGGRRVSVFTTDGTFQRKFGSSGTGDGQFQIPQKLCVDADGNVYVTDSSRHDIQKFDSAGNFLMKWGTNGSGDGELNQPHGIALDGDGNLWVVDRFNYRYVKFDTDGNFLYATARDTWENSGATDIVIGQDGMIYAVMWAASYTSLRVFDTSGNLLRESLISFNAPQGIGLAPNGRIGVVADGIHLARLLEPDTLNQVVQWGGYGSENDQFSGPHDIAFSDDGQIYVADKRNHAVKVFSSDLVPVEQTSMGSLKSMFR